MATTTTSPSAVARSILAACNAHDLDAMVSHYADDLEERMPDRLIRSPSELRAYMADLFAAFPDLKFNVHAMAEDGELVFVHWTITATHEGTFQGVKGTGTELAVDGFERMTIRDGKLVANEVVFDRMAFGQQLGMLPPDNAPAERAMKAAFNARTAVKARLARRR
ncbi:MAG: hypothetical protein QOI80_365 [Solirubrobacteraceae bacterium]|jgi:steroid delta-isomerase-like uncharacterized protein|nr:hypothetical protein [Solirubrobacteraceae bacterium]